MNRPLTLAIALAATLGLGACGNNPATPDWQVNAYGSLASFTAAYLGGNTPVADIEFARARNDVTATARPDLVARVDLVRCAARVASLELDDCAAPPKSTPTSASTPAFPVAIPIAIPYEDMAAPERAYADYLGARWQSLDAPRAALLPEAHRPVLAARDDASRVAALTAMREPLARLVGAGVLFRQGLLPPGGVALAVNTASEQGWRRPLLAWLGVQLKLADAAGDAQARAQVQRRIDLASRP